MPTLKRPAFDEMVERYRTDSFKDHKADFFNGALHHQPGYESPMRLKMEAITWSHPKHSNYAINYVYHNGRLMVTGDCGSAVYEWHPGGGITGLRWIACTEFDYFSGKFDGLNGKGMLSDWEPRIARANFEEMIKVHPERDGDLPGWRDEIVTAKDWSHFLHTQHETGVGWVADEGGDLCDIGTVPNSRAVGHWVGLKMAFERLEVGT